MEATDACIILVYFSKIYDTKLVSLDAHKIYLVP